MFKLIFIGVERLDKVKSSKNDLDVLLTTYEKYKQEHQILREYSLYDEFIQAQCTKATGWHRDYRKGNFNNIHDFVCLNNADRIIKKAFNVSLSRFKREFLTLKKKRVDIAHPYIDSVDISNWLNKERDQNCENSSDSSDSD